MNTEKKVLATSELIRKATTPASISQLSARTRKWIPLKKDKKWKSYIAHIICHPNLEATTISHYIVKCLKGRKTPSDLASIVQFVNRQRGHTTGGINRSVMRSMNQLIYNRITTTVRTDEGIMYSLLKRN